MIINKKHLHLKSGAHIVIKSLGIIRTYFNVNNLFLMSSGEGVL